METYKAKFWKLKTGTTRRCYRTNNEGKWSAYYRALQDRQHYGILLTFKEIK